MSDELLPCPFCGGIPTLLAQPEGFGSYQAYCGHCGSRTQKYVQQVSAIRRWNTRTPAPGIKQPEALNASVMEALRPFAQFSNGFGKVGRDDDWVLVTSPSRKRTITMGDVRAAEAVYRAMYRAAMSTQTDTQT